MEALDNQIGGNHYKTSAMQPVELFFPTSLPFMEGCVVKYICRYDKKNGLEDLQKAKHYVEMLMQFRNKNPSIFKSIWWAVTGRINYWKHKKIVNKFCTKNNLNQSQRTAIEYCFWHHNTSCLQAITCCILDLEHLLKIKKC